jgi:pyrroloquinoline quinone biosynthesis protein D
MVSENAPVELSDRPEINPVYLFRWEEPEQAYVLLFPEGIVKLNDSAGRILEHCNGEKTVAEIVFALEEQFSTQGLEGEVRKFMEVSLGKNWLRIKA